MKTMHLQQGNGQRIVLELGIDDGDARPFVGAAGQRYHALAQLAAAYPDLGAAPQLALCCALCLHFARGSNFVPIGEPGEFRRRYQAMVRRGEGRSDTSFSTADFGPFDVSEVGAPQLLDDALVFYVEDRLYAVPYRVETPWPAQAQDRVKFLLLPQAQ
jgi:hypothetical protein